MAHDPATGASIDAALLYPLAGFFERRGEALPLLEVVPGPALPAPARELLDHEADMTSRLANFHGASIALRQLFLHRAEPWHEREVVLTRDSDDAPVEYGAIAIDLSVLPEVAAEEVRAARKPFGAILRENHVEHRSAPQAFFQGRAYGAIAEALHVQPATPTYGRSNRLLGPEAKTLARIVEILPLPIIGT
jgi:chorismate-pyruvate lyase